MGPIECSLYNNMGHDQEKSFFLVSLNMHKAKITATIQQFSEFFKNVTRFLPS